MSRGRAVGSAFSAKEKTVLDLLCSGDHPYREQAREQLRVASWGGYQLDECDCFLISVPKLPKAAPGSGTVADRSLPWMSRAPEKGLASSIYGSSTVTCTPLTT